MVNNKISNNNGLLKSQENAKIYIFAR